MKNQKGVNLVSLSVAVIVIIAIAGTVLYNVRTNLAVQRLKAMQADIENLRGKVANYYLQYGALPILKQQEIEDSILSENVKTIENGNIENGNIETGKYYVIDLSAMENITLTYGEDYENLKDKSEEIIKTLDNGTLTDVYIINSVSHNIFYVHGITYEGKKYYTQYQDEEKNKVGDSNLDIDINVEKRNNKVLLKINKGEKAPENRNALYKDTNNNEAIIPAGFTVSDVEGESTIKTGLVIRDDYGNEFVWIPVGIPWKTDSTKTITLSRYTFDENGTPTNQGANTIDSNYTELASSSYGNAVAKNIEDFKTKTKAAGGFWIGRYEARVENWIGAVVTSNSSNAPSWTGYTNGKLVEKPEAQVFNYITQNKASELSRTMYTSDYFESDLINSYAWDTATLFLQEYDNRTDEVKNNSNYKTKYSRQIRLSNGLKYNGTNESSITEANKDKICNVYDMADNCFEWTTETCSHSGLPCVKRGGNYSFSDYYTSDRYSNATTIAYDDSSFRPVLYIK